MSDPRRLMSLLTELAEIRQQLYSRRPKQAIPLDWNALIRRQRKLFININQERQKAFRARVGC